MRTSFRLERRLRVVSSIVTRLESHDIQASSLNPSTSWPTFDGWRVFGCDYREERPFTLLSIRSPDAIPVKTFPPLVHVISIHRQTTSHSISPELRCVEALVYACVRNWTRGEGGGKTCEPACCELWTTSVKEELLATCDQMPARYQSVPPADRLLPSKPG